LIGVEQHSTHVPSHYAAEELRLIDIAGIVARIAGDERNRARAEIELIVGSDIGYLSRETSGWYFVHGSIGEWQYGSQWDHVIVARDCHAGICSARQF
jgi:hypothetical protein